MYAITYYWCCYYVVKVCKTVKQDTGMYAEHIHIALLHRSLFCSSGICKRAGSVRLSFACKKATDSYRFMHLAVRRLRLRLSAQALATATALAAFALGL